MRESEEGQSGAPRAQESRPGAHLPRSKDEKYHVTHSTFCRVRYPNNLGVCTCARAHTHTHTHTHTHSGTSLHSFHLPLAPDTSWDACSHHLEPGYLGIGAGTLPEKAMATHSSTLPWRIPGIGEPGGLPSMGLHRVGQD